MAVKRGKSQARRNGGNSGGMPGWAWLILGIVIALVAVLVAPKLLKTGGEDGFIRPSPNPDAQPAATRDEEDLPTPAGQASSEGAKPPTGDGKDADYDFYTLLPGQEVVMSDAELAASARAEEARKQQAVAQQAKPNPDAADLAKPAQATAPAGTAATTTPTTTAPAAATADAGARYVLQAGAFGGSGDAEAIKARIALLGLKARVESADIRGKTVYRVRMGPYGSATELADAKQKLSNGGLPALAIKAK